MLDSGASTWVLRYRFVGLLGPGLGNEIAHTSPKSPTSGIHVGCRSSAHLAGHQNPLAPYNVHIFTLHDRGASWKGEICEISNIGTTPLDYRFLKTPHQSFGAAAMRRASSGCRPKPHCAIWSTPQGSRANRGSVDTRRESHRDRSPIRPAFPTTAFGSLRPALARVPTGAFPANR